MLVVIGNIAQAYDLEGNPYVEDLSAIRRIARRYKIPESWAGLIDKAAWSVGGEAEHLARVLWHESRMNPQAQFGYPNGSPRYLSGKATGLIQFLEPTAEALGTSTQELWNMTFPQQMRFVVEYLRRVATGKWAGGGSGPLDTQAKMALAVFYPGLRNQPLDTPLSAKAQRSNPGVKTIGDYVDRALRDTDVLIAREDKSSGAFVDQTIDPSDLPLWLRLRTGV